MRRSEDAGRGGIEPCGRLPFLRDGGVVVEEVSRRSENIGSECNGVGVREAGGQEREQLGSGGWGVGGCSCGERGESTDLREEGRVEGAFTDTAWCSKVTLVAVKTTWGEGRTENSPWQNLTSLIFGIVSLIIPTKNATAGTCFALLALTLNTLSLLSASVTTAPTS